MKEDEYLVKRNPGLIEIPENATNGDVLKVMFPNAHPDEDDPKWVVVVRADLIYFVCLKEWWDAPYKGEGE